MLKRHWLRAIFGHNLRTRFFSGMQFSQNINGSQELSFYINSRQKQWLDFLKKFKTLFLDHFCSLLSDGSFFEKMRLCRTQLWVPNTMIVSEKTNEPIPRKLMDRRKSGRKGDRTDLFHGKTRTFSKEVFKQ